MVEKNCSKAQCLCLCGGKGCRLCCSFCPSVLESTSTRLVYIIFLMVVVAIMSIMMSKEVQHEIMEAFPQYGDVCEFIGAGDKCDGALGYMAVYRLGFAVTCYHVILMILTCGIKSSRDCRAGVHNGLWFFKFLLLVTLCVGAFFIPDPGETFIKVWMYVAMCMAATFIILQLILLVFMFHNWTDKITARVEKGSSVCCWYSVFAVTVSVLIYTITTVAVWLLYFFFAYEEGCLLNRWFILGNAVACLVVSALSVIRHGGKDPRLRMLHSALITFYVIYLTWTAIGSAPRKYQVESTDREEEGEGESAEGTKMFNQDFYCGPSGEEESWTDEVLPYVGVVIMFVTVIYSSVGTAEPDSCEALDLPSCPPRRPKSSHAVEDIGGQKIICNEHEGVSYSYPLFHLMLALATVYMMMNLTAWYTPTSATLVTFGRSWSAVWIKIGSSWVCLVIYLVTVLFPSTLPLSRNLKKARVKNSEKDAVVPLTPLRKLNSSRNETTV